MEVGEKRGEPNEVDGNSLFEHKREARSTGAAATTQFRFRVDSLFSLHAPMSPVILERTA